MIESGRLNFILMDRKNLFVSDKKENKFVAELEVKQGNYEVEHYIIEACGNYPKAIELLKDAHRMCVMNSLIDKSGQSQEMSDEIIGDGFCF